jgi:stage II sporulation protein AA (anti-sigma F factor antagonist)
MKITKKDQKNTMIIKIEGSLSVENVNILQDELNLCLANEKNVILEFSEVSFIDSSSLGIIVLFYTKLDALKKQLVVSKAKGEIYQMFNLTGVSRRIKVFKNTDDALEYINGKSPR